MNSTKICNLLLLLFFVAACSPKKEDERIARFNEYLTGQATHFRFNGNVLIADKGNIIYQKSFGLADFDSQRLLNDTSVFELASVSKQFTAMGILLLEEKGLLSLDDSLRKFFPGLPYSGITLHHMLTHISGLPDYMELMDEKWDHSKIAGNNEMITLLAEEKLEPYFKPGEKWDYSNTAFAMLATIIEKVSGKTFHDYMEAEIFKPLGMNHTRIYNTRRAGETIDNYAYGFVWSDSLHRHILPDSLPDMNFLYYLDGIQGDGIVNSTTNDLLKWDRALAEKNVLPSSAIEKLTTKHSLADTANQRYYGYGIGVGENEHGAYLSHSGGWPGYTTNLFRNTDHDLTIVVLSNNNSNSPAISNALQAIFFQDSVVMPYAHKPAAIDSASLDLFVGKYKFEGQSFEMVRHGDSLIQVNSSGREFHLIPEAPTKVFLEGRDIQYERDPTANKLYRIFYGRREEVKREI